MPDWAPASDSGDNAGKGGERVQTDAEAEAASVPVEAAGAAESSTALPMPGRTRSAPEARHAAPPRRQNLRERIRRATDGWFPAVPSGAAASPAAEGLSASARKPAGLFVSAPTRATRVRALPPFLVAAFLVAGLAWAGDAFHAGATMLAGGLFFGAMVAVNEFRLRSGWPATWPGALLAGGALSVFAGGVVHLAQWPAPESSFVDLLSARTFIMGLFAVFGAAPIAFLVRAAMQLRARRRAGNIASPGPGRSLRRTVLALSCVSLLVVGGWATTAVPSYSDAAFASKVRPHLVAGMNASETRHFALAASEFEQAQDELLALRGQVRPSELARWSGEVAYRLAGARVALGDVLIRTPGPPGPALANAEDALERVRVFEAGPRGSSFESSIADLKSRLYAHEVLARLWRVATLPTDVDGLSERWDALIEVRDRIDDLGPELFPAHAGLVEKILTSWQVLTLERTVFALLERGDRTRDDVWSAARSESFMANLDRIPHFTRGGGFTWMDYQLAPIRGDRPEAADADYRAAKVAAESAVDFVHDLRADLGPPVYEWQSIRAARLVAVVTAHMQVVELETRRAEATYGIAFANTPEEQDGYALDLESIARAYREAGPLFESYLEATAEYWLLRGDDPDTPPVLREEEELVEKEVRWHFKRANLDRLANASVFVAREWRAILEEQIRLGDRTFARGTAHAREAYARFFTPPVVDLFESFDGNQDGKLQVGEATDFYAWMERNVRYRYDDETYSGPARGSPVGDGRPGNDYAQDPEVTLRERMGDCEDMNLVQVAFYLYWGIYAALGLVNAEVAVSIDHAIALVYLGDVSAAVQTIGSLRYYTISPEWAAEGGIPAGTYLLVDNSYSDVFGTIDGGIRQGQFILQHVLALDSLSGGKFADWS